MLHLMFKFIQLRVNYQRYKTRLNLFGLLFPLQNIISSSFREHRLLLLFARNSYLVNVLLLVLQIQIPQSSLYAQESFCLHILRNNIANQIRVSVLKLYVYEDYLSNNLPKRKTYCSCLLMYFLLNISVNSRTVPTFFMVTNKKRIFV